jgi:uncharacterized membrane protein
VPDLTVWRYPTPLGVDAGEVRLKRLVEQGALTVHDAAAVIWMPGAEAPTIRRLRHGRAKAAGAGSVLGGLLGLVVLAPAAGVAVGAAAGAAGHKLRAAGIDDDVVRRIREQLEPGTSALLVLSSDAQVDLLRPALKHRESTPIHVELSDDAPEELRRFFEEN